MLHVSHIRRNRHARLLERPRGAHLFVGLNLVAHLHVLELLEPHATLGALAHLHDVFLDVFEGLELAWEEQKRLVIVAAQNV